MAISTFLAWCGLLAVGVATDLGAAETSPGAYAIVAATLDAGGRRSASANYTHDGSLGGIAGFSSAATAPIESRHGYVGQFRDVTGLALTSALGILNENETRPLTAHLLYDDQTSAVLNGSEVQWSIVSGPLVSISPHGVATAAAVYQNTAATVRGQYHGYAATVDLLVLNSAPDNFGTYAADGLPDDWQVYYFGLDNPLAAPGADPDGDDQSNAFEYVAGLLPTDGTSRFDMVLAEVPGLPEQKRITLNPVRSDRVYTVEFRTTVAADAYRPLDRWRITEAGASRMITDLSATNAARFYRVRIALPAE